MFWHSIKEERGTWNFNINMDLTGMECEDLD
jgi:hypothetical protein